MEGLRSLILDGFDWGALGAAFAVIGAALAIMLVLSIRLINSYD
jgi:apolipoprotein N-acyltransferase